MSAISHKPSAALEHPTTAIALPPHGDDHRGTAARSELDPGRYLLCGDHAFALTAEVVHIGRGITADIWLDDHTVSARHAIVVARADRLRILDDRSTNGTIVNGRAVDQAELNDGDVIVLGQVVLTYAEVTFAGKRGR
jgi:predicted component of type VI protein secretion system